MRRLSVLLLLSCLLAACATEVEGVEALNGKDLATATSLYGPWAEQLTVRGRPVYLWRREAVVGDKSYFCEMRIEMGFRNQIARSAMAGFPAACALFRVRYETNIR